MVDEFRKPKLKLIWEMNRENVEMSLELINTTVFLQKLLSAAMEFQSEETWSFERKI